VLLKEQLHAHRNKKGNLKKETGLPTFSFMSDRFYRKTKEKNHDGK
jgi:hypothetical protein